MIRYLDWLLRYLLVSSVAILTVSVFLQVLVRFILKVPLPWTEEVARIAFVYSIYLGAILGIRDRAHINVDVVLVAVPTPIRRIMRVIITVAVATFLIFMTWQGVILVTLTGAQMTPVMLMPFRYIFVIIPASGALMLLYLVLGTIDDLRAWRSAP